MDDETIVLNIKWRKEGEPPYPQVKLSVTRDGKVEEEEGTEAFNTIMALKYVLKATRRAA